MPATGEEGNLRAVALTVTAHHAQVNWINRLLHNAPPTAPGNVVAAIGEFAAIIFSLLFAFAGTQVANISSNTNTGTTMVTTVTQKNPA